MKLHTINSGFFKLDGGAMHGVVPKSIWNQYNPSDDNNLCSWAMRCLLVEMDHRLILIDTGIGDKQDEKFFSHYHLFGEASLIGSLKAAGFQPEDITDVFLTHLHFDHVGGAVRRVGEKLIPTFPNATYWTHRDHWQWAIHPNAREKASFLKENILPLEASGQLRYIDLSQGEQWLPGFDVLLAHGHTEAMMLPLLSYKGQRILYAADLVPSRAHIPLPWIMSYDMRPLQTLAEKENILTRAQKEGVFLFLEHDPNVEMCTIQLTDRGLKPGTTVQLNEL